MFAPKIIALPLSGMLIFSAQAVLSSPVTNYVVESTTLSAQETTAQQRRSGRHCRWEQATLQERIVMWSEMGPRHKDYHWRMMSEEERITFRSYLPPEEQKRLRARFVSVPKSRDTPYVLYKRLSKEELFVLREQVKRAHPHGRHRGRSRQETPAIEELELFFQSPDHTHHVVILLPGEEGKNAQSSAKDREIAGELLNQESGSSRTIPPQNQVQEVSPDSPNPPSNPIN